MTINKSIQDGVCHLSMVGDIRIYEAVQYKQQMLSDWDGIRTMKLDLSQVEEIDASGLQLLILLKKEIRKKELSLELAGVSISVSKLLELYRLQDWFQS